MGKVFEYYSTIHKRDVEWLWYPYIACGKITILQGDPGEGKSTVAIRLSALLSTAGILPDGTRIGNPVNIIYQCSEDGLADTIKPRLETAGADCDRMVHIIEDNECLTLEDKRIEETIVATRARLCIIDPLQAYLGNDGDMLNAVRMRNLLRNLTRIAEDHRCAILLICHMSKSAGNKSLYRSLGTIDIAAIARSVLMIARDKDDPNVRYVFQIKNNLAKEGLPIRFRFGKKGFKWLGTCHKKLEDVLSGMAESRTKREQAGEKIRSLLKEAAMPSNQVFEILGRMGISKRTTKMAKEDVGAISYRNNKSWYWSLKND